MTMHWLLGVNCQLQVDSRKVLGVPIPRPATNTGKPVLLEFESTERIKMRNNPGIVTTFEIEAQDIKNSKY